VTSPVGETLSQSLDTAGVRPARDRLFQGRRDGLDAAGPEVARDPRERMGEALAGRMVPDAQRLGDA
jgi:hypothetical protein